MFRIRTLSLLLSSALLAACGAPETDTAALAAPGAEAKDEARASFSPPPGVDPFAEDTKDNSAIQSLFPDGQQASVAPVGNASATEHVFRFVSTTEAVPIYSSSYLNLYDTYNSRYVKYESRDWGINLGWSTTQPRNIRFLRAGGAGPLRFGDVIAINIASGGYVKYGSRTWGINLVWSSAPAYEWQIEGGTPGQLVYTNQRVRLVNRIEGNGLVYCRRPVGVNLAWQDNCTEALGYRILIDYLCSINPIC